MNQLQLAISKQDWRADMEGATGAVLGIRALRPIDVGAVARLHQRAFTQSLLRHLGEPYLRALYRGFLASDDYAVLAHGDGGSLSGYVVVDLAPHLSDARRLLRSSPAALCWDVARAALARPWNWLPLAVGILAMATYRLRRGGGTSPERGRADEAHPEVAPEPGPPVGTSAGSIAVVRYIAVAESSRGQGIGRALLTAAEEAAVRAGKKRMLVTTTMDNVPALHLYGRFGYETCREWSGYDGRRFVQLARELVG